MYETEVNSRTESAAQIPAEVISHFAEAKQTVLGRSVLPWGEHCTECVWPTCYSSCDLYLPREDGKCRRFVDGMVRISCPEALNAYILKIRFKRWGKLWSPGNTYLRSVEKALQVERRDYRIGSVLNIVPLPSAVRNTLRGKRYSLKRRLTYRMRGGSVSPTSFLLECYNPADEAVRLSFTIRAVDTNVQVPFQKLLKIDHGFQRIRISYEEITEVVDLVKPFNVELIPNEDEHEVTLFFGLLDFVREAVQEHQVRSGTGEKGKKVKCVVWDLDNTLWDGILVEDGPDKIQLKAGMTEIIRKLDERGILCSIASKNNVQDVVPILRKYGLEEYFLCPQVSWEPKSKAIATIANRLNIGRDSLLFVDDSEFERKQVEAVLSDVRTIDAVRYREILDRDDCQVPVTDESRNRRRMYRVEEERLGAAEGFGSDYKAFLQHCEIQMHVRPMSEANLERVHELTQRTNQMNFSGNRYDRSLLKEILTRDYLDTFVIEVEDRYGSYGVVGFSIVDARTPVMTDLMFSCRIQSKRIEHAFMAYLLKKYIERTGKDFWANYRKTARNAPSGRVFDDIGMKESGQSDGVLQLMFPRNQAVPDDGLVKVTVDDPATVA